MYYEYLKERTETSNYTTRHVDTQDGIGFTMSTSHDQAKIRIFGHPKKADRTWQDPGL